VASRRVQASKAPYSAGEYASAGRTIIAKHIINQAKAGEQGAGKLSRGQTGSIPARISV
jgi:hypothetical protein